MKYTYQTDGPRGPPAFYWRKNMKRLMGYSFFMVGFGMFFMFIIPSDVIGIIIILILLLIGYNLFCCK